MYKTLQLRIVKPIILTMLFSIFSLSYAMGQGDDCASATVISECTVVSGTTAGGTLGAEDTFLPADICATALNRTVWYTFTATSTATYTLTISGQVCTTSSGIDVGVLTGACSGPYTSVACGTGVPPSAFTFPAVMGQQYFIVINTAAADTCTFDLEICAYCNASLVASATNGVYPMQVNFTSTSPWAINYYWQMGVFGATFTSPNASFTYDEPGTYTVTLIADDGVCSDTATITITVTGASAITIPNVFTPNQDDVNDFFRVDCIGISSLEGKIFNRWGEQIHEWSGVNGGWDGHTFPAGVAVPEGSYFYYILAEGTDGKSYNEKGIVTLLR